MEYNVNMCLSEFKKGASVVLKKIHTEEQVSAYLKNLGLVKGTRMEIILNTPNGTIVLVRDSKIALGRELSKAMEVEPEYGRRVS